MECWLTLTFMVIRVVESSNGGHKIGKIFAWKSTYSKVIINFENWFNGKVSKSDKIWLSKSIFYVTNHLIICFACKSKNRKSCSYHFRIYLTVRYTRFKMRTIACSAICTQRKLKFILHRDDCQPIENISQSEASPLHQANQLLGSTVVCILVRIQPF